MQDAALQKYLLKLFERHDVELEPDEEWLMTDGDFPAVRASWYDGAADEPGRLDIDIVLSEERHIEESFAGAGKGEVGCKQALDAFERSVFHVALAACWYVTDDRRMRLESWDLGVRTWDVFVGPIQSSREDIDAPSELLAALRDALQSESLSGELHWVRLFYRRDDQGQVSAEARLDNAPWPAGDQWLAALPWPASDAGYSVRVFVALDIRDY
ncbi:DUF6348 family protein [Dyella sp. ASV21]|jgi:hypothetical protein|uniref:DUF6348 family protein n=1 Tax=Dyella sp. ASV21 TaxID=2795114 RepID=UPI0018EDCFFB|nr:DUF6348 family protein [Dyella sp. ASV21]